MFWSGVVFVFWPACVRVCACLCVRVRAFVRLLFFLCGSAVCLPFCLLAFGLSVLCLSAAFLLYGPLNMFSVLHEVALVGDHDTNDEGLI